MHDEIQLLTPSQTSLVKRLRFSTDLALRRRFLLTDEPELRANLRFGLLLEILDKLAEDTALRYVRRSYPAGRVVTAAMDSMQVRNAPDEKRDMVLRARVNLVGKTSLEVGIRMEQPAGPDGPAVHVASCYFTMVARLREEDGTERSVPLPGLDYRSKRDQVRAERARGRREAYRKYVEASEAPPNAEEYAELRRLHEAQEQEGAQIQLASPLMAGGWERTYVEHENVPHKIFGGFVAHRAYTYAHICSEMVASHRPLLVSVDRINFHQPVRMGDKLHFVSRVAFTGMTSISVETSITRISRDRKSTALSNVCSFTFVNVDRELHPMPVPQIYPTTYAEDARYLAGYRRHKAYLRSRSRPAER